MDLGHTQTSTFYSFFFKRYDDYPCHVQYRYFMTISGGRHTKPSNPADLPVFSVDVDEPNWKGITLC